MSPLLGVELSEEAVETLEVLNWEGLCRTTSLLRTRGPPGSLMSEVDFTDSLELSPPESALLLDGEASACRGLVLLVLPASVL